MATIRPTVIALDVDGVLNGFGSYLGERMASAQVGPWRIRWRPDVLARLKDLLDRPDVEGAWLTTWLEYPWQLEELQETLGLTNDHIPHRADHPAVQTRAGRTIIDHRFEDSVAFHSTTKQWWKRHAAEMLMQRLQPARFAWIDDELGTTVFAEDPWAPIESSELLLMRTSSVYGLLAKDVDRLENWLDAT